MKTRGIGRSSQNRDMPQVRHFERQTVCLKCGSCDTDIQYCAPSHGYLTQAQSKFRCCPHIQDEHFHHTCRKCSYGWLEVISTATFEVVREVRQPPKPATITELTMLGLTSTQLNAVIAKSLGWKYFWPRNYWIRPYGGIQQDPPDYCRDLTNAWQLFTQVKRVGTGPGAHRWAEFMSSQGTSWVHLSDEALALRLSYAFYYAHTGQHVVLVPDEDESMLDGSYIP